MYFVIKIFCHISVYEICSLPLVILQILIVDILHEHSALLEFKNSITTCCIQMSTLLKSHITYQITSYHSLHFSVQPTAKICSCQCCCSTSRIYLVQRRLRRLNMNAICGIKHKILFTFDQNVSNTFQKCNEHKRDYLYNQSILRD